MPKLKSRRSAMKRYRFTAKGKVKMQRPNRRHNMFQKTKKQKRGLTRPGLLPDVQADIVRRQLPYGSR